jgi:ribosome-binding factor A
MISRMDKVNQQMKREISQIIRQDLSDPRFMFVTITHVNVSKDLRNARVFYSVLGDEKNVEAAKLGLESAKGKIRRLVASKMNMRNTPEFIFSFDDSVEKGAKIEKTLQEIRDELQ